MTPFVIKEGTGTICPIDLGSCELIYFISWLLKYERSDWLLSGHYIFVMTGHYLHGVPGYTVHVMVNLQLSIRYPLTSVTWLYRTFKCTTHWGTCVFFKLSAGNLVLMYWPQNNLLLSGMKWPHSRLISSMYSILLKSCCERSCNGLLR